MDTLEDIDNLKPYSVKRTDTKALFDDEPEDTFFRLLDALSVKATSWFSFQDSRPQLDGTALCCLGLLVEEFIRYQQTPLIDVMHKNLNIPSLKQLLTPEELQSGSLPALIQKYKKKHEFIQEGHIEQRPRLLEDLQESYSKPSRLQQYQEQVSNHVDEQIKNNKKKGKEKEKEKQKRNNKKNTELNDTQNEEEEEQEEEEEEEEEKSNSVGVKVESITESQFEPESSSSSSSGSSILPPESSSQPSQARNKPRKHEKKTIRKKRKASESDLFDTMKKKSKVINKSKAKSKSKPTSKPKAKKPSFF